MDFREGPSSPQGEGTSTVMDYTINLHCSAASITEQVECPIIGETSENFLM